MVFVNIKDVVALIVLIFALAVCGTIIMVDHIAFTLKKRRESMTKKKSGDYMAGLIARFKWWINKENKYCKSCCVFCRYFIRCQIDVAREKE